MKPRNWRKRFGTPLTSDRELRQMPEDFPQKQAEAYRDWLRPRVVPTDADFARVRAARAAIYSWRLEVVAGCERQLAAATTNYYRRKAGKELREAKYLLVEAIARLDENKGISEQALEKALQEYIDRQRLEPAVVVTHYNDSGEPETHTFATDRDFRRAWKQMELPA